MFYIKIAGIIVEIHNKYPLIETLCRDYFVSDTTADIIVKAEEEEIDAELAVRTSHNSRSYAEFVCVYRKICFALPEFDAFLLHSAVVDHNGRAYAFAARSGIGKTTHARLWLECFPDARIINGDKPIIRFFDRSFFAFGTPWCGKEGYNINIGSRLHAVCFIERGEENSIIRLSQSDSLQRILNQVLIPKNPLSTKKLLNLIDIFLETIPCYLLYCTPTRDAAITAYRGMNSPS